MSYKLNRSKVQSFANAYVTITSFTILSEYISQKTNKSKQINGVTFACHVMSCHVTTHANKMIVAVSFTEIQVALV